MTSIIPRIHLHNQVHGSFNYIVSWNVEMELLWILSLSAEQCLHKENFREEVPVQLLVDMQHLSLHVGVQYPMVGADIENVSMCDR